MDIKEHFASLVQRWKMRKRIARATRDRSADALPKVDQAGNVIHIDGEKVQVMHNGVVVSYGGYHDHWMGEIIRGLRGHHEPLEELFFDFVLKQLPDKACMLELGSYWAYYSLWFRHKKESRKCFLIEPIDRKLALGKKNFQLNGYEAEFARNFISNKDGSEGFVDDEGAPVEVKSITIDTFLNLHGLAYLDILHSDIQGAELDMLEGAASSLSQRRIGYLFLSTHDDKHPKCLEVLTSHGYRIIAEHDIDSSSSADGLIVAASPDIAIDYARLRLLPAAQEAQH